MVSVVAGVDGDVHDFVESGGAIFACFELDHVEEEFTVCEDEVVVAEEDACAFCEW